MGYVVAVDTGGTFSDCVAIDQSGRITAAKAPSTPPDYSRGVVDAIAEAAALLGLGAPELLRDAVLFAHGTTVATNALLTRTGARTGMITTVGHEDAVIIGRVIQKVAGLTEAEITDVTRLDKADPIVPRPLIKGVHERMDCCGQVVAPLNQASLARAVDELAAAGVEAIAVSFLWSFLNPAHEQQARDYIRARHPGLFVTLSSDLVPLIKEYERGITTAMNAYLSRRTRQYLHQLRDRLAAAGYRHTPVVMQSWGGVATVDVVSERAVGLLTSGPAGGVIGARLLGQMLGYRDIITTDVGGTSFDVGLVVDGEPVFADAPVFAKFHLATPVIDVATIGAGGGSVAWLEPRTGLLRVGPRSAGADPGPACYAMGGTEPTVTDANVVLGRINPDYFLGGRRRLDAQASRRVIAAQIARPLGMDVAAAAAAIVTIADAHMTDLVRKVSLERGYDPRRFVLFTFGGAGPLHAGAYGRGTGCTRALVPVMAAEFSAFGIAGSEVVTVEQLSDPMPAPGDPARAARTFAELERRAAAALAQNQVAAGARTLLRFARLRYRGQVHELQVPVPAGALDAAAMATTVARFEQLYEERYGQGTGYRQAGIQILSFSVRGLGRLVTPHLHPRAPAPGPDAAAAVKAVRPVYFREHGGHTPTPIYAVEALLAGHVFAGPAIVEARDTTTVVHPGQRAEVDGYGNLVLHYG